MTVEETNSPQDEEQNGNIPALAEMLNVTILSGVVVIPLIMPFPKEEAGIERVLFAKFQLNDNEDAVVYDAMVPLDVLAMFSLNLLKACTTAFRNVGEVKDQDMLFVNMKDLRESVIEGKDCLASLEQRFRARDAQVT